MSYRKRIDRAIAEAESQRKLEAVFPPGNQWHDRIFYDTVEGKYYDKYSDVYLTLDEMKQFGGAFRSEDAYGEEVERVNVETNEYYNTWLKQPKGVGSWAFKINGQTYISDQMSYEDAKKWAVGIANKVGAWTVKVLG